MIQFATDAMQPDIKRIWAACFGDSAEYIDFLFDRLLRPEHILVDTVGGRPVSMLCIEPLVLATRAGGIDAAYLFGVATLPEQQGSGRSTALLEECHRRLAGDGFALSILVPAGESLFRFYGSRGYETAFMVAKLDLAAGEIPPSITPCALLPAKLAELSAVRDEVYADRAQFVRWGRDYLAYIGDECALFGGEVLRTLCGGETGYAVCYRQDGEVVVKELAVSDAHMNDAMAALHARYGADRYRFYLPADTPNATNKVLPFAMVRWYDKVKQQTLVHTPGRPGWITHVLD